MKAFTFYPKRNVSLCANREFFKREIDKQPLFSAKVERKDTDEHTSAIAYLYFLLNLCMTKS